MEMKKILFGFVVSKWIDQRSALNTKWTNKCSAMDYTRKIHNINREP